MAKKSKTDLFITGRKQLEISNQLSIAIPYPNTQSLIEGQTIKFGEQIIYKDYGISNMDLYKNKTDCQLVNQPKDQAEDNVIIEKLDFPQSELILLGRVPGCERCYPRK